MSEELTDLDPILCDPHRIERAVQKGVQDALRMHKRAGNPIAVWRDGQVVWLPPEEIPVSLDPAAHEADRA